MLQNDPLLSSLRQDHKQIQFAVREELKLKWPTKTCGSCMNKLSGCECLAYIRLRMQETFPVTFFTAFTFYERMFCGIVVVCNTFLKCQNLNLLGLRSVTYVSHNQSVISIH